MLCSYQHWEKVWRMDISQFVEQAINRKTFE